MTPVMQTTPTPVCHVTSAAEAQPQDLPAMSEAHRRLRPLPPRDAVLPLLGASALFALAAVLLAACVILGPFWLRVHPRVEAADLGSRAQPARPA